MVSTHHQPSDGVQANWRCSRVALLPVCLWLVLAAPGAGQQHPVAEEPPRPASQPSAGRAPGHETEAETIAKCLNDMRAADAGQRRRAVLILGKYDAPAAQAAVIEALADADATVRQSALVSLGERPFLPMQAPASILRCVTDEDVHVRRLATSMLAEAIAGVMMTSAPGRIVYSEPPPPQQRPVPPQGEAPALRRILNQALADDDRTVRRNVLALHPQVGALFEPERLAACLKDPDREIRLLALRASAAAGVDAAARVRLLTMLVDDPEAIVREELVRSLAPFGQVGLPPILRLAEDKAPAVRVRAVIDLAQRRDESAFARLTAAIQDDSIPAELRRDMVPYLVLANASQAGKLLEHLASQGSTSIRAEAVRVLGGLGLRTPPARFFIDQLDTPSSELRRALLFALHRQPEPPTKAEIRDMLASVHADVRAAALHAAQRLSEPDVAEITADALLDADVAVRVAALRYACLRGIAGWEHMLRQSLRDPAVDIQRAAIEALARRHDAPSRALLEDFMRRQPDSELSAYARDLLDAIGKSRPAR